MIFSYFFLLLLTIHTQSQSNCLSNVCSSDIAEIPSNGVAALTVTVNNASLDALVTSLEVEIYIVSPYNRGLKIELLHDSVSSLLWDFTFDHGSTVSSDPFRLIFSDSGIDFSNDNINCNCKIKSPFSQLNSNFSSHNPNGKWILSVLNGDEESGFIYTFCLHSLCFDGDFVSKDGSDGTNNGDTTSDSSVKVTTKYDEDWLIVIAVILIVLVVFAVFICGLLVLMYRKKDEKTVVNNNRNPGENITLVTNE